MQGNFNQTQRGSIKGKISLTGNLPCSNSYKKLNWGSSRFIHIMLIKTIPKFTNHQAPF